MRARFAPGWRRTMARTAILMARLRTHLELKQARDWGYQRMVANRVVLLAHQDAEITT